MEYFPSAQFPNSDVVSDEYKLLKFEKIVKSHQGPVDKFWDEVGRLTNAMGDEKYANLDIFIKSILSVSHGNADVERGFSISGNVLTEDKTNMTELTLNARLNTLDEIRHHDNKVHEIEINRELVNMANSARKSYELRLAQQREEKRLLEQSSVEKRKLEEVCNEQRKIAKRSQKELQKEVSEVKEKQSKLRENQMVTDEILEDARSKLSKCIKEKNFVGASVAEKLLENAMESRAAEKKEADIIVNLNKKIFEKQKKSFTKN